jgi:hypothetical protein
VRRGDQRRRRSAELVAGRTADRGRDPSRRIDRPRSATLHYRYGGGSFIAQGMTPNGSGLYSGTLPAPQCGDSPEFYFSVNNTICGVVTEPGGAPTNFTRPP